MSNCYYQAVQGREANVEHKVARNGVDTKTQVNLEGKEQCSINSFYNNAEISYSNSHHNHLGSNIFINSVFAALSAKAALLDATKRRRRVTNSACSSIAVSTC
jgi:hypothetical protein